MAELLTAQALFTLLMLVLLQAVLGFDNLLYIAIESNKVGDEQDAGWRVPDKFEWIAGEQNDAVSVFVIAERCFGARRVDDACVGDSVALLCAVAMLQMNSVAGLCVFKPAEVGVAVS